jgi:predicted alpha/beta superfamily hydrolase
MHAPHVLPGTEIVELPPRDGGRRYQLHVSVPASHAREPARRYPVVYLTDPQWDFPLVYATAGNLAVDGAIPECILVGVGYAGERLDYEALRAGDLPPVPDPTIHQAAPGGLGADGFLRMLEGEVLPLVERTTPADPARRVLLGSSMGGLFALYAMMERPRLFPAAVAVSPAVLWANGWLFGHEERFAAGGGRLQGRVFLSGAAEEWPDFLAPIVRFEGRLRGRAYPELSLHWRLIEGERHSGTKAEGFTRGLRFSFGA